MTKNELIEFEAALAKEWEAGKIRVPVHFCGGNEDQLIEIFKEVREDDWVISTHRNHYHALLHGVSPDKLLDSIRGAGKGGSMVHISNDPPFISTGIVAGGCGLAIGLAWALKEVGKDRKVWCFVGDGATDEGHWYEAVRYAVGWDLPVIFVVEDNNRATCTSNEERWGTSECEDVTYGCKKIRYYRYAPTYPHVGTGKYVQF